MSEYDIKYAHYILGIFYRDGTRVPKDYLKAFEKFEKGAKLVN